MHSSAPSPSATTESRNETLLSDETAEKVTTDEVATIIFSFLPYYDIMSLRRVCKTWIDAAKETLVPLTDFEVDSVSYNALRVMSTALPNLQQITLRYPGIGHKYSDGEDPDEEWAQGTADWTSHDIDIISSFSKLRILDIYQAPLSGRYPLLFNFPLLQKLTIRYCGMLKWDLEMLEGLPSLKELDCRELYKLEGNLSSLRLLKDTLERVKIVECRHVEGNFMDLADFPRLKELDLRRKWLTLRDTAVTGDIRDIRGHDFPALERLFLPKSVRGGIGYEIQNSDVPSLLHTIDRLLQRTPDLFEEKGVSQAFCSQLQVDSVRSYNSMRVMSTTRPNYLQQLLMIWFREEGHKYSDGEDPDEEEAEETADETAHDIDIISSFGELRSLEIENVPLNRRYPVLFDFPILQKLSIFGCSYLKWDLEMLERLPSLKELDCGYNPHLTGSLSSLRVLKNTLENVEITNSDHVEGNFMDLADFPRLKKLGLSGTNARGDIREVGEHDFPALERLFLPKSVYGGIEYEFEHFSGVRSCMQAIHLLLQRSLTMFGESHLLPRAFNWTLSADSTDWYERGRGSPNTPFCLHFIQAGSRLGWCWCNYFTEYEGLDIDHSCEINWLDPEPSSECSDYEAYIEELQHIEWQIEFYRGYYEPPTEEEYRRLCEGLLP